MTTHHTLVYIVGFSVLALWLVALVGYLPPVEKRLRLLGHAALVAGWLVLAAYMIGMWIMLERPPMRTMIETLQWVTLFMPAVGLIFGIRWRMRVLHFVTLITAMLMLVPFLLFPEIPDKAVMPALQSPWFAPHVLTYMVAYAVFGVAAVVALYLLIGSYIDKGLESNLPQSAETARRLVYFGFPLLAIGLLLGAYWAKICWGTYWGWDPKETWAFITWAAYLGYIHTEVRYRIKPRWHLFTVFAIFLIIPFCWFGVNKLPTAKNSIHTYSVEK